MGRERNSILCLGRSDQQLQEAYLSDARMGIEGASAEVFAATDAALREQLRDNLEGLVDLEEHDIAEVIGHAKCLVQDALAALYAAESRKRNSETAARAALLDAARAAVAEVVAGEALREEEGHGRPCSRDGSLPLLFSGPNPRCRPEA